LLRFSNFLLRSNILGATCLLTGFGVVAVLVVLSVLPVLVVLIVLSVLAVLAVLVVFSIFVMFAMFVVLSVLTAFASSISFESSISVNVIGFKLSLITKLQYSSRQSVFVIIYF